MKKRVFGVVISVVLFSLLGSCSSGEKIDVTSTNSDLVYPDLAKSWDEGVPLGNAFVGALIWQKDNSLRLSLDRVDLWDTRDIEEFTSPNFSFDWVKEQVRKKDYAPVQQLLDVPYNRDPFPSKIPGGALEISLEQLGEPNSVRLYIKEAVCEVVWLDGVRLKTFVDANSPIGWFIFENVDIDIIPNIIAPKYASPETEAIAGSHSGPDLERLGYKQGEIRKGDNLITYHQTGWGDFYYDIAVKWEQKGNSVIGVWSVTSSRSSEKAVEEVEKAMKLGIDRGYSGHKKYWDDYWAQSTISIPDSVLQKQYDSEMYKFASASRENSYPISLQSVWTADHGKLPPWKGDFHHDLNTQLSYWPAYIGNRLSEGLGYVNTLWNQRETSKKYTKDYFGADGLNVPGVSTLEGEPMGGWIQYAMSPTVSAWLSQHFYLHWKYSADRDFLQEKAYPYIKDVAIFLEQITIINSDGYRTLEISSSPEINDNSIDAWFKTITNYDLGLIKFAFSAASELAAELNLNKEAKHWKTLEGQLPAYDLDRDGALTFAKGHEYNSSHRHFSNALAFHPLGLLDWSQGKESQQIIRATVDKLDEYGSDWWCGYSYSWLGNIKARIFDGDGAAEALKTFAECFCLRSTFHANGDQTNSGKSNFTYRPFTLEGNFAFASGIQEMLLQSHSGIIRVFPATPQSWSDVSFDKLRAMGAFLVSAQKSDGELKNIQIISEKGGECKLALSDASNYEITGSSFKRESGVLTFSTNKGDIINIKLK